MTDKIPKVGDIIMSPNLVHGYRIRTSGHVQVGRVCENGCTDMCDSTRSKAKFLVVGVEYRNDDWVAVRDCSGYDITVRRLKNDGSWGEVIIISIGHALERNYLQVVDKNKYVAKI